MQKCPKNCEAENCKFCQDESAKNGMISWEAVKEALDKELSTAIYDKIIDRLKDQVC